MPGKVLHIFDFDGTLFRSPEPNPKLWTSSCLGKIKTPTSQSGLGWYQELITLEAPYVHENPDVSWFNPPLLEKCRSSLADPNAITVLLTGRLVIYEQRLKHILKGANLNFHHYGLKPGNYLFTMDFKLNFISELREKYKDEVTKVIIYEDRSEHAAKFEQIFQRMQIDCEVVRVEPNVTYLDRELEIELVKKLIAKNAPSIQIAQVPAYTGLTLDEKSRNNLLSWVPTPPNWIVKAHHMTIALGDQAIPGDLKPGDKGEIEITHIGFDTRSLAAKVTGVPSTNEIPHVTIAHAPTAKPVDSNAICEWVSVEELAKNGGVVMQRIRKTEVTTTSVVVTDTVTSDAKPTTEASLSQTESITVLTLQTAIPPHARLSGTINVQAVLNLVYPPRVDPNANYKLPKGVSIGELVKKRHPDIPGKTVGAIVSQVRAWAQGREDIRVEEIEDLIKSIDINSLE